MDKQLIIKEMLECDICRQFLALSMEDHPKCGGISYKEINGEQVPVTRTGKPWSEVVKEHKDKHEKIRKEFYEKNKDHITAHSKRWKFYSEILEKVS
jgi:hypothetical protein